MRKRVTTWLLAAVLSASAAAEQRCNSQINAFSPAARFTINLDGTATDGRSALVWQRCPAGYAIDDRATPDYPWDDSCEPTGEPQSYDWTAAFSLVSGSWRLPTVKELMSIAEYQCADPALNLAVFPDIDGRVYWSSTAYRQIDEAASVDFFRGYNDSSSKTTDHLVRLVRPFEEAD